MEWLTKENLFIGGSALFGLYIIARLIAAFTATPKDDEALEKVGVLLKGIWKVVGIDIRQGRKKE
jgi:hypothetical protein